MRMTSRIVLAWLTVMAVASCRKHLPVDGERCTAGDTNCICDAQSGECTIQGVDNQAGNGNCPEFTCTTQNAACGQFANTCTKKTLDCGDCASGQVCQYTKDSAGKPSGGACIAGTETSCASQGFNCGTFTDPVTNKVHDCTKEVGAGQACTPGTTCGGSGLQNVCGCTPLTCTDLGRVCGDHDENGSPLADGCGGTLNCDVQAGGCGTGKVCNPSSGTCSDANCKAKTCTDLGNPCGQVSDGCGGLIACSAGKCSPTDWCDPTTHKCLSETQKDDHTSTGGNPLQSVVCDGRVCGQAIDACNVGFTCAPSSICGGQKCIGNHCSTPPPIACPVGRCGTHVTDAYGGTIAACNSATCPPGQVCADSTDPALNSTGYCVDPVATTCLAQGKNCGDIEYNDGTGTKTLNCGTCPAEPGFPQFQQTCGGSGVPGVCALQPPPLACISTNTHCGLATNTCGDQFQCGTCAIDNKCQNEPAQNVTKCEACAHGIGTNGDDGDYLTCSSTNTPLGPYLNHCGSQLDNHCYGKIDCACPPDNSNGLYGAPYKKSTGTVACGATQPDTLGQCVCTPDPNVCKNANSCDTTLPDDGCGHPVTCGVCATIGKNAPVVCEQDNKTCCAPDFGPCATSCKASKTTECGGQITLSCNPGCTPSPAGDTETVCGSPCSGNPINGSACNTIDGSCCANNVYFSTVPGPGACCPDASYELASFPGSYPNGANDRQVAAGACCKPWDCAGYFAAHANNENTYSDANKLPDGCGGFINAICNRCDTGDGFTKPGGTNNTLTECVCPSYGAADCATQVPSQSCGLTIKRSCTQKTNDKACGGTACGPALSAGYTCTTEDTCAQSCAGGHPGSCNGITCNTCDDAGKVCGNGSGTQNGICCAVPTCGAQKCGTVTNNCTGGTIDCTNNCTSPGGACIGTSCCASGIVAGSTCCAAGQHNSSSHCCNGASDTTSKWAPSSSACCDPNNITGDGLLCCGAGQAGPSYCCGAGTTYDSASNCCKKSCGSQTCGSVSNADPHACSASVTCSGCTSTCNGNCCPKTACDSGKNCGTQGDGCGGTLACGTCSGDTPVCNGNSCGCAGAGSCTVSGVTYCDGRNVGNATCPSLCNSCPSGATCTGGQCKCAQPSCGTQGAVGTSCTGQVCDSGTCSASCVTCSIGNCDTGNGQVCAAGKCCLPNTDGLFNYCQDHQGGQYTDNCGGLHNCNGGGSTGG